MTGANCWEIMKCGREPGGSAVDEHGVCPAAVAIECDGLNGGQKAGRICWVIAGTLCKGKPSGRFISKMSECLSCEFYKQVVKEEGRNLTVRP